jgi:hypothetical protein
MSFQPVNSLNAPRSNQTIRTGIVPASSTSRASRAFQNATQDEAYSGSKHGSWISRETDKSSTSDSLDLDKGSSFSSPGTFFKQVSDSINVIQTKPTTGKRFHHASEIKDFLVVQNLSVPSNYSDLFTNQDAKLRSQPPKKLYAASQTVIPFTSSSAKSEFHPTSASSPSSVSRGGFRNLGTFCHYHSMTKHYEQNHDILYHMYV